MVTKSPSENKWTLDNITLPTEFYTDSTNHENIKVKENNDTKVANVKKETREELSELDINRIKSKSEKSLNAKGIDHKVSLNIMSSFLWVPNKYSKTFILALKKYQKKSGIEDDGILWPLTINLLIVSLIKNKNYDDILKINKENKDLIAFNKAIDENNVSDEMLKKIEYKLSIWSNNMFNRISSSIKKPHNILVWNFEIYSYGIIHSKFQEKNKNNPKYEEHFKRVDDIASNIQNKIIDKFPNISWLLNKKQQELVDNTLYNPNDTNLEKWEKILDRIAQSPLLMVASFISFLMVLFWNRNSFAIAWAATFWAIIFWKDIKDVWTDILEILWVNINSWKDETDEKTVNAVTTPSADLDTKEKTKVNIDTVKKWINSKNETLWDEKLDNKKIIFLNKILFKNEKFLDTKIEDYDKVTSIWLWLVEKFNKQWITQKDLEKYIILLKKQSRVGNITFRDILLLTQTNEGTNSIDLFNWIDYRLASFKINAQKIEDLETLGVIMGKDDELNKLKQLLKNDYNNLNIIIWELKLKLSADPSNQEILNKLNKTYLFLSEYYSWWTKSLDNDHTRNYNISSAMAIWVLFNKDLVNKNKYPDLNLESLKNNPEKFDIDLEKLLSDISIIKDSEVQKAIKILEDNRWVGFFDLEEETTDLILNGAWWTVVAIWTTIWVIMTAPGWVPAATIAWTAGLVGAWINTVARWESSWAWQFLWEAALIWIQSVGAGKMATWSLGAISKSTSTLITAWIISTEVAVDVIWIWMWGEAIRAELFDLDYNLASSFYQNLMWAPLTLLGWGGQAIKQSLNRAKIKNAIWNKSWMLDEVKFVNKEIIKVKEALVWKKFDIEVKWTKHSVEINEKWEILSWTKILDYSNKDDKIIIDTLVKKIHKEKIFNVNWTKVKTNPEASNNTTHNYQWQTQGPKNNNNLKPNRTPEKIKVKEKENNILDINLKSNKFDKEFKTIFNEHTFVNDLVLKWDNFSIKISKVKEGKYNIVKIDSKWNQIEEILQLANERKILKEINKIDPKLKSNLIIEQSVESISKLKKWQSFGPRVNFIFWDKKFQILENWKLSVHNKETWIFDVLEWEKLNKYIKQNPKIIDKIKKEYVLSVSDEVVKSKNFWDLINYTYNTLPKNMKAWFLSAVGSIKDGTIKTSSWLWEFTKDLTYRWFGEGWPAFSWKILWTWLAILSSPEELNQLIDWKIDWHDWAAIAELIYKFTMYSKLWIIRWITLDQFDNIIVDWIEKAANSIIE